METCAVASGLELLPSAFINFIVWLLLPFPAHAALEQEKSYVRLFFVG